MNKINFKKIAPGIISVVIIAGMAIQSFATNVDMAAFVKKDTYMTKYYELDFRIDDIEKSLARTYRFVCTNLKSYGGTANTYAFPPGVAFYTMNNANTYYWYVQPIADISEEKYLRFNYPTALFHFGNHRKTDEFVSEVPASLLKWRDGIELKPNTKVKTILTRTTPNGTSTGAAMAMTETVIMGPFKKFPQITGTGSGGGFINVSLGRVLQSQSLNTASYQYGTETEPTSWISTTGNLYQTWVTLGNGPSGAYPEKDYSEYESIGYDNMYKANSAQYVRYFNAAFGANLSSYENVWLRFTFTSSSVYSFNGVSEANLTTWNVK